MHRALRVCVAIALFTCASRGASSATITVPPDGDLQQALKAARPGDTIQLTPGATYVGNFTLPPRMSVGDTRVTVLRTGGPDAVPPGTRMTPAAATKLAKLRSPNNAPALATSKGTRFWRIELVEFLANRDGAGDIITLGDGSNAQRALIDVPTDLVIDRIYMHGDEREGQKRGIALNSGKTTITNSYIGEIKARGQDSQAIGGWNGTGDYLIQNNFLEAAGENVLFGGADPSIDGLTTTGIVIRNNTISKPTKWRDTDPGWQVKNLLELKNARNVVIERNLFERNWEAAQSGYSILFTVRNQDGSCRWCQVEDVKFRQNVVRDVAAGIQITGIDNNNPSRQTNAILIQENLFYGIDNRAWGGDGYFIQLTNDSRGITIDHNTVIQGESNGIAKLEQTVQNFVFTNNIIRHGNYGIIAANRGIGNDSIRSSLPGAVMAGNVI
ncbi:MAG TPA: right-handed parallel beta-helix repeat-containing protein, partial [Vicinamibacterales bacterium]|nr:right-handed parallel beta-helix repeat-containing protein [Vicinamibacterales bacterium]